jgi:hypothetical protein
MVDENDKLKKRALRFNLPEEQAVKTKIKGGKRIFKKRLFKRRLNKPKRQSLRKKLKNIPNRLKFRRNKGRNNY